MNMNELLASIEVELEAAVAREAKARKGSELILATAQQESRAALTPEEDAEIERLFEVVELAQAQQQTIRAKQARAQAVQAQETDFDARMAKPGAAPASLPATSAHRASVQVGREERTYSKETDPHGKMFFGDVINQFVSNDVRAGDRLGRHIREEQIERSNESWVQRSSSGVGTGAFSGLTVPQYLIDMVAPAIANMRPFADKANQHPLPAAGMSVNISRITTASTAALQSAELASVSFTDMDDTLLTVPVQTAAGQQLVSRQAIERGTGIEDVILQDLMKRYSTVIDSTMITQATTGLSAVANNTDLTTGQASATSMYPAIVGAISQSATATRGYAMPDFCLMHPRRWYWLQSQLVSTWPAFGQPGINARNLGSSNDTKYDSGNWDGVLPCGVGVIVDANVTTAGTADSGTGEDEIYVGSTSEVHLWEDSGAPVFIRAEQPSVASLGVNLVVYGYFAYTMQRYTSAYQKLTGSGLVAPTGF